MKKRPGKVHLFKKRDENLSHRTFFTRTVSIWSFIHGATTSMTRFRSQTVYDQLQLLSLTTLILLRLRQSPRSFSSQELCVIQGVSLTEC